MALCTHAPAPSSRSTQHAHAHTSTNTPYSASVVSILRVALLPGTPDVTYTAAYTGCWTMAETAAGLVCPCLMTLGPLLKRVRPGLGFSHRSSDPARARGAKSASGRTDPGAAPPPGSRQASRLGHHHHHHRRTRAGDGSGSETELCRDDDSGPPTTIGERSAAAGRPVDEPAEGPQAFELGPVSRPRTGPRRDS